MLRCIYEIFARRKERFDAQGIASDGVVGCMEILSSCKALKGLRGRDVLLLENKKEEVIVRILNF